MNKLVSGRLVVPLSVVRPFVQTEVLGNWYHETLPFRISAVNKKYLVHQKKHSANTFEEIANLPTTQ